MVGLKWSCNSNGFQGYYLVFYLFWVKVSFWNNLRNEQIILV
jgi:hypothetical protein